VKKILMGGFTSQIIYKIVQNNGLLEYRSIFGFLQISMKVLVAYEKKRKICPVFCFPLFQRLADNAKRKNILSER